MLIVRKVTLTKDALVGESLIKQTKVWTRWFCPRRGVDNFDWAEAFLAVLCDAHLPGDDYLMTGFNLSMDKWLSRRATYKDFEKVLVAVLVAYGGVPPP